MREHSLNDILDSSRLSDGLRFCVINHGCKVNRVEADSLSSALAAAGGVLSDEEDAQLIVVNTCTVTGEADHKARKAVRHALKASQDALVVVTGCGAAVDPGSFEALGDRVTIVDRMILSEAVRAQQAPLRTGGQFRTRVNLKIQDGCDNACTYCIVHVARGPARSVALKEVIEEAQAYLSCGVKEIVLTGIDLGSYRAEDADLAELAKRLVRLARHQAQFDGMAARIRASSLEPQTLNPRFIELLASSQGNLCRHVHLPLQSGSTKVLGEMARPYTADFYEKLVTTLYREVPSLSLTTDIIVGFPGETEEEFRETLDLARACRFSKIHVFPYSRRAGTPAAQRDDQIEPEVIKQRAATLRQLAKELRTQDRARRANTSELVLVEGEHALTESYHEVPVPAGAQIGQLVNATIS